jgi:uncharacterized protein YidB (DUF937 family)
MGLLDQLGAYWKGAIGQTTATATPGMLTAVLAKTNLRDLQGLVTKLQQGGLDQQVKSWLGNGSNLPVTPDQLRAALGNEHVKQLAAQFGLPVDAALNKLAEHLPAAVDQASPSGTLKAAA